MMTPGFRGWCWMAGLVLFGCSSGPEPTSAWRTQGDVLTIRVSVVVDSVDVATRRLSLKGAQGHTETYIVRPEVQRLSEVKAGDRLFIDYTVVTVAELREPTAEEKKGPQVLAQGIDRTSSDQPPGATVLRLMRVVATLESVDAGARIFTVRAPLDGMVPVRVQNAEAFAAVNARKSVVVTFNETLLLHLEPAPK